MAIVVSLLVLLTFGMIDFARIFSDQIQLSQGAREGVRLAALGTGAGYTAAQVQTRAQQGSGSLGATVTIAASDITMCPNANNIASVAVHYQFKGVLFRTGSGINLVQSAVMRCGG